MRLIGLATLLLLQAGPEAEIKTVTVTVTDEKGSPLGELAREEVVVLEDGVARDVAKVVPDERPLTLVVIVDTSQAVGSSYRLNVVGAVEAFLARLPQGARYAVWTTGDRPTKLLDFTEEPAAAKALRRVATQGGNTVLDGIVEASRDLKKQEGHRSAVVVVSGVGIEFSSRDKYRVVEEALPDADVFHTLQFEEGEPDFETRQKYDYVFSTLARRSGGVHDNLLSSMGLDAALRKLGAELRSTYRVSYASLPEVKASKVEVRVARPGVRVRVAAAGER